MSRLSTYIAWLPWRAKSASNKHKTVSNVSLPGLREKKYPADVSFPGDCRSGPKSGFRAQKRRNQKDFGSVYSERRKKFRKFPKKCLQRLAECL